jgi:ElaB/YqjD/DUF883 family membrane-anchored ribosome-binding protein
MKNSSASSFEDRLDSLKESMRNLVDIGSDRASALKDRVVDVKDSVVGKSKTGVHKMGAMIKQHPIVAVGVAFGVGYLVMRIVRR